MNKWHPWVQNRNDPEHFSPSLSLHTPPLQQVSYHTQHRCLQLSIEASGPHRNELQEFSGLIQSCCGLREFHSWTQAGTQGIRLPGMCLPLSPSLTTTTTADLLWGRAEPQGCLVLLSCPTPGFSPCSAPGSGGLAAVICPVQR